MLELLEKIILAGAGFANLTKEKAEEIIDVLVKKGQVQAKDKKALLSRLLKNTEQLDRDLEKKMHSVSLNVVKNSQKQIDALSQRLAKLTKELETAKKSSGKSGTAKKSAKKPRA